ncbi:hypothetical protein [Lactobacillus xylocopicola]|uniref:Uncharacterized protein n=1 Tax=Lactobacillus xylocopicola TaxID=2976676 RepID=A0ABM8BIA4_9LACO|nr:hypothetical protein [Lactobacillus xylocopicola]BDR60844.1 hypothetical protein KIM322_11050 [Lactobacillus xylocopicola]
MMFNLDDPHQFCEVYDDEVLICRWTMDRLERQDGPVWIMNHFFINPSANHKQVLSEQLNVVQTIAQQSHLLVWPLDPLVIDYFKEHPQFDKIWYHKPAGQFD